METDLKIKRLWINKDKAHKKAWEAFLYRAGISIEENVEYTIGLYDRDRLIGTGSIAGNVLKCIAIDEEYTGGRAINILISHLMDVVFERGYTGCYVYTKPSASKSFEYLGFKEIARVTDKLVFMEKAVFGFPKFLEALKEKRVEGNEIAGIVMNANPFTNGHLHLVETAAKENDVVHLFVLSEDASVFPAEDRYELVKKGVAHLDNVYVHRTGNYMVSMATFPSYFLKETADVTKIHATLDAIIFKKYIAPTLSISRRYVGEEPYSLSTNIYNQSMAEVFDGNPQLIVIPRKKAGGSVISASRVRKLLEEGRLEEIKLLVPNTTYEYLISPKGQMVRNKLMKKE
jgi:[citrate (pro-3S)-lyase] ligase